MPDPFVIDGVCHPYNFAPENQRGRFGQIFTDILWSFHPLVNPPDRQLGKDAWQRDWRVDEFMRTMLLESDTHMVCMHSTPIFDAYEDGLASVAKGAELKRRWPDRVLWYGTADIFKGEEALESLREQVGRGADGIKLYPAQYYVGRTRYWRMDDYTLAFPVFELAQELGVRNIAVHKALPLGPVATDSMRIDDIGHAASAFPDLNFQIVHAGFMFMDETKMLVMNYPNVYATLEASFLFCMLNPLGFTQMIAELLAYGGPEKIIYASAAVNPHPKYLLDAFGAFQMPPESPLQLTDEVRAAILGGNLARLHGIDIETRRKKLAEDEFARAGRQVPWTEVLGPA